MAETMPDGGLVIRDAAAGYGAVQVLWGVDLDVRPGEITALIGSNGAGKTTLMRTISGLLPLRGGSVTWQGRALSGAPPAAIIAQGIAHVPEGRRLFGAMSVEDNLVMGAYLASGGSAEARRRLERTYTVFPKLFERRSQQAATLSGGEQQMCAIGRGLMSLPRLLMVDELSLGLSPLMVETLIDALKALNREGMSILLVEQDVVIALEMSDHAYVMDQGRILRSGPAGELLGDPTIRDAYLGVID